MKNIKEVLESKEFKVKVVCAILNEQVYKVKVCLFNKLAEMSKIYNEKINNAWRSQIMQNLKVKIFTDNIDTILQINCSCNHEIVGAINFTCDFRFKRDKENNIFLNNEYVGYIKDNTFVFTYEKRKENKNTDLQKVRKQILEIMDKNQCKFVTDRFNRLYIKDKNGNIKEFYD